MESSAPKRRRTSPRTAVPTNNENEASSTTPTDPPPDPPGSSKRPSFASPTKASLWRHNPDIAERRRAATRSQGADGSNAPRPTSQGNAEDVSAMLNAQLERHSEAVAGLKRGGGQQPDVPGGGLRSAPADPSMRSPARKLGGALATRARRSPIKPNPRPLPPPGPIRDEEVLNPFAGRTLRRSGGGVLPTQDEEEPNLPPTPEQLDPEITTPPSGIHSTPSKRPRRSKSLAEKIKSSPLKQPPLKASSARRTSPRLRVPDGHRKDDSMVPSAVRGVKPSTVDSDKKKLRDSLLAEIAQLESDLKVATNENDRIRRAQVARVEASAPWNADAIIGLIQRHSLPVEEEVPDATTIWLRAALNPMCFLPFGKQTTSLPDLFDQALPTEGKKPPISHHPIQMTAEEQIPYLQAFTPLVLSSNIMTLPQDTPDSPLLQKHTITAISANPPGLFAAQIDMTVNTKTVTITDLSVPRLDPAASSELNPLIDSILNTSNPSSALTRNINILAWAMGEWLRVSLCRARFWHTLDKELGTKDAIVQHIGKIRNRRKRKRRQHGREQEDDSQEQGVPSSPGEKVPIAKEELLPHMGRLSMDLDIPKLGSGDLGDVSGLRVQWRIGFDWSGEAQSQISILVGVPGKWHHADERESLAGLPGLFDKLVQGNEDPVVAVETIVALLAGDGTV